MADSTPSSAANIAVRAFLTEFTEEYLREVFGHRLSDGKYKRGEKEKEGDMEVRQKSLESNQR